MRRGGDFPAFRAPSDGCGRSGAIGDLRPGASDHQLHPLPGRPEPFQARLAPTCRKRQAPGTSNGVGVAICLRVGFNVELPPFEAAVTRVGGAQAGGIRHIDGDRPACSVPGKAWPGVPSLRDSRRVQSAARVQRDLGRLVSRPAAAVQRDGRMARKRTGVRLTDPEALLSKVVLRGSNCHWPRNARARRTCRRVAREGLTLSGYGSACEGGGHD